MTMHLVGPWLSTTGKKKGKVKYRNAEAAQRAKSLREGWENLKTEHGLQEVKKKSRADDKKSVYVPPKLSYRGSDKPRVPSAPNTWAPCVKAPDKVYTGDAIIGIGTLHKSNAVPIFSKQEATDIAKMRR